MNATRGQFRRANTIEHILGKETPRMRYAFLIAAFAISTTVAQKPQKADPVSMYSRDKEGALAARFAEDYRQHAHILDALVAQAYSKHLGDCLAAKMPESAAKFTFSIMENDFSATHEPVSLPGGYILVPAALFTRTDNEAEFAGMLAHAMAHITNRHYAQIMPGSTPATGVFMTVFGDGNSVVPANLVALNREYETAADLTAAETVAAAGFDPHAFRSYLARTQEDPDRLPVFSRYPARGERLAALDKEIARLSSQPRACYLDFNAAREEVRGFFPRRPAPSLLKSGGQ